MKRDFTKDFNEITEMTNKIRSINETINFGDQYCEENDEFAADNAEFEAGEDEVADAESKLANVPQEEEKSDEEKALETEGGANALNQIRQITLKGMIALCNTPEDPVYQTLKKVFTMIDRAVDKSDEEQVK